MMSLSREGYRSITANSSRAWLDRHPLKVLRYLRRYHRDEDAPYVFSLLFESYPDEGKKLIQNFGLSNPEKKNFVIEFAYFSPQITCGLFADQRMGKDATFCSFVDDVFLFCKENKLSFPRIVTLGNIRCPPFVMDGWDNLLENIDYGLFELSEVFDEDGFVRFDFPEPPRDMYFSFKSIPAGVRYNEVWIYSSEIETILPARGVNEPENKLFSQLEGTLAQNHQKLFGCCKLASKVDLNFIRGMNMKIFKFISPEKLNIEGVERVNIISDLGRWLLPHDPFDNKKTLFVFDNQLLTLDYDLPFWWTDEYSEQFRDIPMEKVWEFVEAVASDEMKIPHIQVAVAQKFRKHLSKQQIESYLGGKSATSSL